MGKDWMEARKTMFTVDLFDSFLENIQRAPRTFTEHWSQR